MKKSLLCLCTLLLSIAAGCGGGGGGGNDGNNNGNDDVIFSVANSASPYKDVLADCAMVQRRDNSCTLNTLPLIGQEHTTPTVSNIMDRTLVSHPWMAKRFRAALKALPPDILKLFRSVTAVVISADIRPSYYTAVSGAVYIDPANLWLNNEEKTTISNEPDYRSDFGNELNFVALSRYISDRDYAWEYYSLAGNDTRTIQDIEKSLAALLLHELGHANDAVPPAYIGSLDPNRSIYTTIVDVSRFGASEQLNARNPLNSNLWYRLGEVLFEGRYATPSEQLLTAANAGLEFEYDGASDSYAYASMFEDTAMLFEEVMMKYLYGIDRELAFTSLPTEGQEQYCNTYKIRWGYRNRVANAVVIDRAKLVLNYLLNETNVDKYLRTFSGPKAMTNGYSWCRIQPLSAPVITVEPSGEAPQLLRPDSIRRVHDGINGLH